MGTETRRYPPEKKKEAPGKEGGTRHLLQEKGLFSQMVKVWIGLILPFHFITGLKPRKGVRENLSSCRRLRKGSNLDAPFVDGPSRFLPADAYPDSRRTKAEYTRNNVIPAFLRE